MDYKKAANYWLKKDEKSIRMNKNELLTHIEKFIMAHNTCALATGYDDFIRCTPIEYNYKEGSLWLFSEGGMKFRALEYNKNVCLAIFDNYTRFGQIGGMQITGRVEIVEPWTDEYMKLLEFKKMNVERLRQLTVTLYLMKVIPTQIDFLNSEFTQLGVTSRQTYIPDDSED